MEPTLSLDTAHEVEARQIEGWRRMTPVAKIALVLQMSAAVREVALGDDLARRAYPEIAALAQP